jgi:hypothetical protein
MLTRIGSLVLAAACAFAVAGCALSTPGVLTPRAHVLVVDAAMSRTSTAAVKLLAPTAVHSPTSWPALNRAIARVPGYRSGIATWTVSRRYGHWGTTVLASGRIYISPTTPKSKLYSVAAHEYGHALTSANYGRHWQAMGLAMNRWFGGGVVIARERAADCIARAMGATWTNYTVCSNPHWRAGARILLAGKRLP